MYKQYRVTLQDNREVTLNVCASNETHAKTVACAVYEDDRSLYTHSDCGAVTVVNVEEGV